MTDLRQGELPRQRGRPKRVRPQGFDFSSGNGIRRTQGQDELRLFIDMCEDLLKLAHDIAGKPARGGQRFELGRRILPALQLDTLIGQGLHDLVPREDRLAERALGLRTIGATFGHHALQPAFALGRRSLEPHLVGNRLRQFQL